MGLCNSENHHNFPPSFLVKSLYFWKATQTCMFKKNVLVKENLINICVSDLKKN